MDNIYGFCIFYRLLVPNVLGIERLGPVDVARALNNGPAVWKNGEIMAIGCETKHELVMADLALGSSLQDFSQGGKIELAGGAMGHLDGIATTKRCGVGAHFAFKPLEVVLLATGAVDLVLEFADLEPTELVVPDIDVDQFSIDGLDMAGQNLDGFGGLQAGDDIDGGG